MEAELVSFIECETPEQCQQLRDYMKGLGAEISTQPSAKGMEDDLHKIIGVCDICFQKGDEADIEAVLNGIVSVVIISDPDSLDGLVLALCEKVATAWEPEERHGQIALRVLRLLFFTLSDSSAMRYHVYYHMVQVAAKIGEIRNVFTSTQAMLKMFSGSPPTAEQLQKLYRLLHTTLTEAGMSDDAYKVMLEMLDTYTKENASQAREDAQRCIVASLADPKIYILDHLLPLKPVKFLEGNPIHDLLTIAVCDGLSEYKKFYENHKEYLQKQGLDHSVLVKKMKILSLISLADSNAELSFERISRELELEGSEVESFVIEALKTKLLTARIEQNSKKVIVKSVVKRGLTKGHWIQVREILGAWRANLKVLKENMSEVENIIP